MITAREILLPEAKPKPVRRRRKAMYWKRVFNQLPVRPPDLIIPLEFEAKNVRREATKVGIRLVMRLCKDGTHVWRVE